jgi:hypothetical protein
MGTDTVAPLAFTQYQWAYCDFIGKNFLSLKPELKEDQIMAEQDKDLNNRISRRTLMTTAGATLVGSSVACSRAPSEPPQAQTYGCKSLPPLGASKPPAKEHGLIRDDGFRNAVLNGKKGFEVRIRPSVRYRGYPLKTVRNIELKIDGKAVNPAEIIFTLNGKSHKVAELRNSNAQWWIFDYATLFVPKADGLSAGEHDVELALSIISTYQNAFEQDAVVSTAQYKKRLVLES